MFIYRALNGIMFINEKANDFYDIDDSIWKQACEEVSGQYSSKTEIDLTKITEISKVLIFQSQPYFNINTFVSAAC
jgi:hypothetical protein